MATHQLAIGPRPRIVLGTHNAKKAGELAALLAPYGVDVRSLSDYANAIDVVESGDSFAANAALKATEQARHLRSWVIGEDSGLCVDALQGAPGIFSARYAGPDATDERNIGRLLEALAGAPLPERTGHYVCHLTLSNPDGQITAECEAICRGRIRFEPSGSNGFGYDPLFEIVELHRTFGELEPSVKAVLSHRARAIRRFIPQLLRVLKSDRATGPR